jgi:histidinol phosphatase-like enzyme
MNTQENTVSKEAMGTLPKIVAVDFDGTIVEDNFPEIGKEKPGMIDMLKALQSKGVKLILWTSRDHDQLQAAVDYCKRAGLNFDAVNENLPEVRAMFNNDTRKVYADLYIDDKGIPDNMAPGFWLHRLGLRYDRFGGMQSAT